MVSRMTVPLSRRNVLKLGGAAAALGTLGFRPGESFADGDPLPTNVKQPDRGGTFRIRMAQSPPHFDPHQTAAYWTMVPLSFAYSRLLMKVKAGTVGGAGHAAHRERPRGILGAPGRHASTSSSFKTGRPLAPQAAGQRPRS